MKKIKSAITKYRGSVALPTVILISSILLISGINVVLLSIDIRKASKSYYLYTEARLNAQSCLEEGIAILKFDPDYVGSIEISEDTVVCDGSETNIGGDPTLKELIVSSTFENSVYQMTYEVNVADYPVVVTRVN